MKAVVKNLLKIMKEEHPVAYYHIWEEAQKEVLKKIKKFHKSQEGYYDKCPLPKHQCDFCDMLKELTNK